MPSYVLIRVTDWDLTPKRSFGKGNALVSQPGCSVRPDVLLDQRPGPDARHGTHQDPDGFSLFTRDLGEGVFSAGEV
jgi:hypothetical protein